jgi:tetratricopeptide (TPR) repeat protein
MSMHLSDPPKPLNQVREDLVFPHALEEVVNKSLAKNPDQRYQTMEELSEALEAALKEPIAPPVELQPKRPELKPGPLAQDESMESARKLSAEQNAPKHTEYTSRALEHLRSSGVYEDQEGNPVTNTATGQRPYDSVLASNTANQALNSRANFGRGRGSVKPTTGERVQSVLQKGLLAALILIVLAGIVALAANYYPPIAQYLPWKGAAGEDVQTLITQKKYEEALFILQDLKERSKLDKRTTELFGKVCVQLAKQYAKDNRYDDAIALLQQVPKGSPAAKDSRELLKRYRHILDSQDQ